MVGNKEEIRRGEWVMVYPKTYYGRNNFVVDISDIDIKLMKENFGKMVKLSGQTYGIMENETTIKTFETCTLGKEKIDGIWRRNKYG